jgi:cyclopropane fatty-acyl-phospholipid synthase-like methyltransferase
MMDEPDRIFEMLRERYTTGVLPWDEELPPPEIQEFVPSLEPGRALDLGCGFGRASIFMAQLGWDVDAIDFIPEAVSEARRRAEASGVTVRFHVAPVTDLDFLNGPYDFAVDVGCCHSLDQTSLHQYKDQLERLLRPGGTFMLFARLKEVSEENSGDEPPGLSEMILHSIFSDGFRVEWVSYGVTQVEDKPPWRSGWYRFVRQG